MVLTIAIIVFLSTLGIVIWNLKGKVSPIWVKLPAPGAILVGYWILYFKFCPNSFLLAMAIGMTVAFIGDTLLGISMKRFFLYGLASFAVGYIIFNSAIISTFYCNFSLITIIGIIAAAITALIIYKKFTITDRIQMIAVPVYYLILVILVGASSLISPLALISTILLFACDSIIGLNNFHKPIKGSDGYSLFAYNTGHFLLFYSIYQLQGC